MSFGRRYESYIEELQTLSESCSWTSTYENKCNEDKCINDDDDVECCCIKLIAEKAFKVTAAFTRDIASDTFEEMIKFGLHRDGNYAIMKSYVTQTELSWGEQHNQGMGWHRSEDRVFGINPYRGYLTNKKWNFNEDSTIFISFSIYSSSCQRLFWEYFA